MLRSPEYTETKQKTHLHLCLPLYKNQAKILQIWAVQQYTNDVIWSQSVNNTDPVRGVVVSSCC